MIIIFIVLLLSTACFKPVYAMEAPTSAAAEEGKVDSGGESSDGEWGEFEAEPAPVQAEVAVDSLPDLRGQLESAKAASDDVKVAELVPRIFTVVAKILPGLVGAADDAPQRVEANDILGLVGYQLAVSRGGALSIIPSRT